MSESDNRHRLHLFIGGKRYMVERIRTPKETVGKCWRLLPLEDKEGHGPYTVFGGNHHPTCECADFTFVKATKGGICKHIEALTKVGLLP